ncbi:hypothetical protein [Amycolatopsis magusensis]|uniref:hypothetical protein n=1 Tax=Amycolatopsis magusensis TaxID=882444 RepID=UPI003795904C
MIARTWSARATEQGAEDYRAYFEHTLLPRLRELPGFSGAYLLSRENAGLVELTTHTLWESPAAIRSFAGEDPTAAVVEPEASAFLRASDSRVVHRTVLLATGAD